MSYLDVVTEQTIALSNERTEAQIQARRVKASVQLLKALGGGWDRATLALSQGTD
ncbi:outer membrane protein TolC [Paraburkholderia sp. UCT70]